MLIDRRTALLSLLGSGGLFTTSDFSSAAVGKRAGRGLRRPTTSQPQAVGRYVRRRTGPRNPRVLLVTATDGNESRDVIAQLDAADGDFTRLRERGWIIGPELTAHVQLVDAARSAEFVSQQSIAQTPWAGCLQNREIVRTAGDGSGRPLDYESFYWLLTGEETESAVQSRERATGETSGAYPVRNYRWMVVGDDHPIIEFVLDHLRSSMHGGQIPTDWNLDEWSYPELRSLHDDLHEFRRPRALLTSQASARAYVTGSDFEETA